MMKNKLLKARLSRVLFPSLIVGLLSGCFSSGQSSKLPPTPITVAGVVVSQQSGAPLPGVHVVVKGTSVETVTDEKGSYTVEAPDAAGTLVFFTDGFLTQQIPIDGEYLVDAALKPGDPEQEEEVAVGYGTQRKKDITGAISSVSTDDVRERPVTRLEDLLVGRVAGVTLAQTAGGISIRIRGTNSIYGNTEPLYVVDGLPVQPGTGGSLAINPSDIKSIEVLKDAASTAIYGSRGANGVIIVTTKRGRDEE